jgi:hypothetical protein
VLRPPDAAMRSRGDQAVGLHQFGAELLVGIHHRAAGHRHRDSAAESARHSVLGRRGRRAHVPRTVRTRSMDVASNGHFDVSAARGNAGDEPSWHQWTDGRGLEVAARSSAAPDVDSVTRISMPPPRGLIGRVRVCGWCHRQERVLPPLPAGLWALAPRRARTMAVSPGRTTWRKSAEVAAQRP